jgi:hypothetical protein
MPGRLLAFIVVGLLALAGTAHAQGKAELQWFSQAGFKLTTPGGKVIMIDPWIKGATKLPDEFKDLGKLGKVDLILVTHGHGDHLGDAMEIAKTNDVPMWAPAGLNQTLLTLGLMPAKLVPRMSKGGTIEPFPGVKITMVRAEHSSEMIPKDPATAARRLDDARKSCKARPRTTARSALATCARAPSCWAANRRVAVRKTSQPSSLRCRRCPPPSSQPASRRC